MPVTRAFCLAKEIPKLQAEEDLRTLAIIHNPYSKQPQSLVNELKKQVEVSRFSSVTTKIAKEKLKGLARVRGLEKIIKIVKKKKSNEAVTQD